MREDPLSAYLHIIFVYELMMQLKVPEFYENYEAAILNMIVIVLKNFVFTILNE